MAHAALMASKMPGMETANLVWLAILSTLINDVNVAGVTIHLVAAVDAAS